MRSLVSVAALLFVPGYCCADTVEVSGGGHIAGSQSKIVKTGNKEFVLLKVDDDLAVAIQKTRVSRVTKSNELTEYSRRAQAIQELQKKDHTKAHHALAMWCANQKLMHQYRFHMQRVIELDPDHEEARAALRYVKDGQGNWVLYSQQQRNRGMVSSKGRWHYPESVAKQRMQEEAHQKSSIWIKDLARLRSAYLGRSGKKSAEAAAQIRAIDDPFAAGAIAGELEKSRGKESQPRALRMLWIELLGKFRNLPAVKALVKAGVEEPDAVVREAALEQLKSYGYDSAVATYVPMLKSNSRSDVSKALRGLTYFPDPELAMTYIDALVTTHKKVTPPGPGTSAGFTNNGSGSFSTGGKAKVQIDYAKNPDARVLLTMIEPEADFGFDKKAWRAHFAAKLMAYSGSLRRDP